MSRSSRSLALVACGVAMALLAARLLPGSGATRVVMLAGLTLFEVGIVGGLASAARPKRR